MDLKNARNRMDEIDGDLLRLFTERMSLAREIGSYKASNGLPVYAPEREREILNKIADQAGPECEGDALILYSTILALSRSSQYKLSAGKAKADFIRNIIKNTPELFPARAGVACQGVEGAYSQIAASRLFPFPSILYFKSFDNVFSAIESGLCEFGIVPIENSTAGSVNAVYDRMIHHDFYIVKSIRIRVRHSLLAKKGTDLRKIKEIYSHEQAITQCSDFLKSMPQVTVHTCENTAVAAKLVAESPRDDIAALSSDSCAELYGLERLAESVQNNANNFTRFICISKKPQIYPGADRTSLMLVTSHKPGALYHILAKINALGLNILKLESRPIPDREFEFMFYFDIEAPCLSPKLPQLIAELEIECEQFKYLGTYTELF